MESQGIINLIAGTVLAVSGWLLRELWAAVKDLRNDLTKLREDLPKDYVIKNDYRRDIDEVKMLLNKIFDRLDDKVDK